MAQKVGSDGQVRKSAAAWAADTRIYDQGTRLFNTGDIDDDSDATKFKLADGFHAWADLEYFSPGSGGGGSFPADSLTQAEVDGIQASTDALTGINAVVSAQELGNSLAANSSNRIRYQFDTATGDADPGAGKFRLNNGTIGSATLLYISETDREGNALSALLDTLGTAGTLVLRQFGGTDVASFTLGAITDASGYKKIGVTLVQGSLPANDDEFILDLWGVLPTRASLGVPSRYRAQISDLASDPPVVDQSLNQLGGTPAWARPGSGVYTLTITGAFTALKTYFWGMHTDPNAGLMISAERTSANTITFSTFDADGGAIDPISPIQVFIDVEP